VPPEVWFFLKILRFLASLWNSVRNVTWVNDTILLGYVGTNIESKFALDQTLYLAEFSRYWMLRFSDGFRPRQSLFSTLFPIELKSFLFNIKPTDEQAFVLLPACGSVTVPSGAVLLIDRHLWTSTFHCRWMRIGKTWST